MVTATSGPADHEQGLATGLAATTQQIGITVGAPIMSAIATVTMTGTGTGTGASAVLGGLRTALAANAALVVVGALASAAVLRGARSDARSGAR
ncbi:hypothetical protein QFZ63_005292 [Streptomyces sp. B3I7]|nr:hypothetical protein [Streptomyces sp. B3I7]MDQ0813578.1 hypothetical protein [Streptomyces sp. B3I7]